MTKLPQTAHKVNAAQKRTIKTVSSEKEPSRRAKKEPSRQNEKEPSYYLPVPLVGVCGVVELRSMLSLHAQQEWSGSRAFGLLALVSWFCGQGSRPVRISAALARQYVSPLKYPKHRRTMQEPLKLLCHLGIIEKTAAAVFAHVKVSAQYRLAPDFAAKVHRFTALLPPGIAHRLQAAEERKEQRLGEKHQFRDQLLIDLARLGLAQEARAIIATLHRTKRGGGGLHNIIGAIDGQMHTVNVDTLGTIGTTMSSLPRVLKPYLTLDGQPVVNCDVSHMHHCFLPRILANRIDYLRNTDPERDLAAMQAEHKRLVAKLSGADYYREWCQNKTDDDERQAKKGLINALLNMPNRKIVENGFYQWMKGTFPHTFSSIEAIKRADHRNLSKQLQRFTSNAINGALSQCQREGIASIPQTDAIICQQSDQERVREIIGKHVFRESSGVRCKVNGILTTA